MNRPLWNLNIEYQVRGRGKKKRGPYPSILLPCWTTARKIGLLIWLCRPKISKAVTSVSLSFSFSLRSGKQHGVKSALLVLDDHLGEVVVDGVEKVAEQHDGGSELYELSFAQISDRYSALNR